MRFLSALLALLPLAYASNANVQVNGNVCTVVPLGGGQDDGPNVLSAFSQCGDGGTIVLDSYYVVGTVLVTTGLKDVNIELSGTVQYTPDIAYWSPNSLYMAYQNATTYWFLSGDNLHLYGGGTLDANGQVWWDYPNKTTGTAGGSSTTFARPVPLTVGNASNVVIEDLTEISSPFWNNFVYQSTNVTYRNINISSVSYSSNPAANSDGWDIYRSSYITIENSTINNDDDCVSFKPNTTNVIISNLHCNGSHGISVGSLGQYAGETDIVANIYVNNVYMANAENGARIKVFGGSPYANSTAGGGTGYVQNVTYQNFQVVNVDNPITVDQCYDTDAAACAEYPSQLNISDVHFIDIYGTSSGEDGTVVVDIECSSECQDITATGINLTSPNGTATYVCQNVASESQLDFNCTAPSSSSSA
ncbi:glycoside hydrolase family 28 protein [Serpula lacrymans var. lacrymans S7.3]|uniref:galacturonan 1,4-alpha-galacturonidase n=2 Tax=Serpula lacrymans var. lacrymans TaxID=341189 RepID=F8Q308_SERL3|nr:glycoside hydrolase family 28 protein [Serpula lacrymans var. lacrymans S7.9]EGN97569.1 glycoside hydrolase family 28 protein [Serpula lacrymans var. lacrymans S7.3]EGO23165.1 glycoside hydrolase family 28 protein [Serpula lacrymans var. lacrymans S7.9]